MLVALQRRATSAGALVSREISREEWSLIENLRMVHLSRMIHNQPNHDVYTRFAM